MYKLIKNNIDGFINSVKRDDGAQIPFDPANVDYQQFKAQINASSATLQDADGKAMSVDEAKQFVATLP